MNCFEALKPQLLRPATLTENMEKRGGGILDIQLIDCTSKMAHYYQLEVTFETVDAMGANFINSCLEQISTAFDALSRDASILNGFLPEVVMSILSNYVPHCVVRAEVSCTVDDLTLNGHFTGNEFAKNSYKP